MSAARDPARAARRGRRPKTFGLTRGLTRALVIHEGTLAVLARNCRAFEGPDGTSLPVLLFAPTGEGAAPIAASEEADVLAEAATVDATAAEAARKDSIYYIMT